MGRRISALMVVAFTALGLSAEEERACFLPLSPVPQLLDCRTTAEVLARASLECLAEPAFRVSQPASDRAALAMAAAVCSSRAARRASSVARAALAERERIRVLMREVPPGRFSGQLSGAARDLVQPLFAFASEHPLSARALDEYATERVAAAGLIERGDRFRAFPNDGRPATR